MNADKPVHLGKLGPQFRNSLVKLQRIDIEDRVSHSWRTGTFFALHQDQAGDGNFTFMIEELPALIEQLQALVPVVEQLGAIKTDGPT